MLRLGPDNAGIVDDDIGPAENLFRGPEDALHILRLRDVALDGDCLAAAPDDIGGNAGSTVAVGGIVNDDGCTFGGKASGDPGRRSIGSTGDNGGFSGQSGHGNFLDSSDVLIR